MKTTMISKSLEEVWEWKERCYEEAKGMSTTDYLKKVHANADNVLKERFFKGKTVHRKAA